MIIVSEAAAENFRHNVQRFIDIYLDFVAVFPWFDSLCGFLFVVMLFSLVLSLLKKIF